MIHFDHDTSALCEDGRLIYVTSDQWRIVMTLLRAGGPISADVLDGVVYGIGQRDRSRLRTAISRLRLQFKAETIITHRTRLMQSQYEWVGR